MEKAAIRCVNHFSRFGISRSLSTHRPLLFKAAQLSVNLCNDKQIKSKPDINNVKFGHVFTDHMFEVEWNESNGWGVPKILPIHDLALHPGSKVLHYAQELFEGMKAYRGPDSKIRLFRPDLNMQRMYRSALRLSLPKFDVDEMLACIKKLVAIDADWVPSKSGTSLYIRPTFIGTEPTLGVAGANQCLLYVICCPVGPYFATGVKPVSLMANPKYVRSWPGGCGDNKLGCNYAPTIAIQKEAEKLGNQQVLWLYGEDHQLTEVGTMNIFILMLNDKSEKELITPPLDGSILPGITRISLIELARGMNKLRVIERSITMKEIMSGLEKGRILEIFGAGTACVVCPVDKINYNGKNYSIPTMNHKEPLHAKFLDMLTDIQYGKKSHPWSVEI